MIHQKHMKNRSPNALTSFPFRCGELVNSEVVKGGDEMVIGTVWTKDCGNASGN